MGISADARGFQPNSGQPPRAASSLGALALTSGSLFRSIEGSCEPAGHWQVDGIPALRVPMGAGAAPAGAAR